MVALRNLAYLEKNTPANPNQTFEIEKNLHNAYFISKWKFVRKKNPWKILALFQKLYDFKIWDYSPGLSLKDWRIEQTLCSIPTT